MDSSVKAGLHKQSSAIFRVKWSDFFRKRILILEDILAGKNSINESELLLSEEGHLALTAESEEVVEEAMNLVRSSEASRLSGYIGQR